MGGGHIYLPFRELYHSGLNPPHQYTFDSRNNANIIKIRIMAKNNKIIILNKWKKADSWSKCLSVSQIKSKLISILGLQKSGSWNSYYNRTPILTSDGRTLTIRIADHPAKEINFNTHNKTDFNVSLLMGKNVDELVIMNAKKSEVYEEILYKCHCFKGREREKTIAEIIKGMEAALKDGTYAKGKHGFYLVNRKSKSTTKQK